MFPTDGRPEVTFTVADAQGTPIDFIDEILAGKFGTGRPARFTISKHQADGTYDAPNSTRPPPSSGRFGRIVW